MKIVQTIRRKLFVAACAVLGCAMFAHADPSQRVISLFENLCMVPRSSHHEGQIGDWIMNWASENGQQATRDDLGNIRIDVPGTPSMERRELIIFHAQSR